MQAGRQAEPMFKIKEADRNAMCVPCAMCIFQQEDYENQTKNAYINIFFFGKIFSYN